MNIYDSIECPNCGNIVPIGKFCIYCGEDVSKNIQKNFYEVVCPKCESITPFGDFCLYCGSDVSNEPIYIRARDCIMRKYKKETIPILDVNLFLENVFKLKNFSLKAIYITFKDSTEKKFLDDEISLSEIKKLNFLDIKIIDFIVVYSGLYVHNLISMDLNRREVTFKYTCDEVLFLFKKFLA